MVGMQPDLATAREPDQKWTRLGKTIDRSLCDGIGLHEATGKGKRKHLQVVAVVGESEEALVGEEAHKVDMRQGRAAVSDMGQVIIGPCRISDRQLGQAGW